MHPIDMDNLRTFEVIGARKLKGSFVRLKLKDEVTGRKIRVVRPFPWSCMDPKELIGRRIPNCKIEIINCPVAVLTKFTKDNETGELYRSRGWYPEEICAQFFHDHIL